MECEHPNSLTAVAVAEADDEAALVAAAQHGDFAAFEILVNRYERKIFRLARNITRSHEDAEDVMQEAFLKSFQHLADFQGNSRFYTWLVRITVNQALMKLRRRRPNQVSLDEPIDTEDDVLPREVEDWGATPEERYSQTELGEILSSAIARLKPGLRVVFQLRDVEKLSTEETAELLGISIPAAKSRLLRARLELRNKLAPHFRLNPRRRDPKRGTKTLGTILSAPFPKGQSGPVTVCNGFVRGKG